ncbi:hypothetical protein EV368DRAFT_69538 [Lentinula lateritia]|nr:hypothetical protein EV368DRAFT_69538 [Lentinula lateritia]
MPMIGVGLHLALSKLPVVSKQLGHLAFQDGQPLTSQVGSSFSLYRDGPGGIGTPYLGVMAGFADNQAPLASLHLARDFLAPASFAGSSVVLVLVISTVSAIIGILVNGLVTKRQRRSD